MKVFILLLGSLFCFNSSARVGECTDYKSCAQVFKAANQVLVPEDLIPVRAATCYVRPDLAKFVPTLKDLRNGGFLVGRKKPGPRYKFILVGGPSDPPELFNYENYVKHKNELFNLVSGWTVDIAVLNDHEFVSRFSSHEINPSEHRLRKTEDGQLILATIALVTSPLLPEVYGIQSYCYNFKMIDENPGIGIP